MRRCVPSFLLAVALTSGSVSAQTSAGASVWDADAGTEKAKVGPLPDDPYGLALAKDGKRVAVAGYGGHVAVWEIPAGKAIFTKRYKSPAYCVIFSADESALVSGHDDGHVRTTPWSSSS